MISSTHSLTPMSPPTHTHTPLPIQGDGSLAVTGDYSGIGHVWDLRSGKSVYQLMVSRLIC